MQRLIVFVDVERIRRFAVRWWDMQQREPKNQDQQRSQELATSRLAPSGFGDLPFCLVSECGIASEATRPDVSTGLGRSLSPTPPGSLSRLWEQSRSSSYAN